MCTEMGGPASLSAKSGGKSYCVLYRPPPPPPQAILDLDGSSAVSQEEFLTAARSYVELSKMASAAATEEVRSTLTRCSRLLAGAKVRGGSMALTLTEPPSIPMLR